MLNNDIIGTLVDASTKLETRIEEMWHYMDDEFQEIDARSSDAQHEVLEQALFKIRVIGATAVYTKEEAEQLYNQYKERNWEMYETYDSQFCDLLNAENAFNSACMERLDKIWNLNGPKPLPKKEKNCPAKDTCESKQECYKCPFHQYGRWEKHQDELPF